MAAVDDLVVVGGGLAGWSAAVRAQELGCSVTLVERDTRRPGHGNSVVSGGVLHSVLRDPRSPADELEAAITELTDGHADPSVVRTWARSGPATIDWLESHGASLMTDPEIPMRARVFDPVKPTVPGMAWEGFGTVAFLRVLADLFEAAGGSLRQPARAMGLERRGECWAVSLEDGAVLGARAVALCDGGFQADPELLRRYVGTDAVRLRAAPTGTGDALRMALSVGAVAFEMAGFYGHILARAALERDDLWPYPILDLLCSVGVVVSPDGRRLVDEGHSGVTTSNAVAWSAHPDGCWLVIDDEAWEGEGRLGVTPANPWLLDHGAVVLDAPTLGDVAAAAGIDAAGLERSVGAVVTDPHSADPGRSGRVRLSVPPFHAIPIAVGVTFTLGGVRVDGAARVLDSSGAPIPGLYAAGGTMGGLHGGPRAGYAGGLLEAATFGLVAGAEAACYCGHA
jgi:fumarate reductase flavoprotein subunit